jgi:hypothetical protein
MAHGIQEVRVIPQIDNRLHDWSAWRLTPRGYGYRTVLGALHKNRGASGAGRPGAGSPRTYALRSSPDPEMLVLCEAAVRSLPPKYSAVVLLRYAGVQTFEAFEQLIASGCARRLPGELTIRDMARELGCNRHTVSERLGSAHRMIEARIVDYRSGTTAARKWLDRFNAKPPQSDAIR